MVPTLPFRLTAPVIALLLASPAVRTQAYDLPERATAARPLSAGHAVPDPTLRTPSGAAVSLRTAIGEGPAVLVFYRGGWCPYCSTQLAELRKAQYEVRRLGFRTIAMSADPPAALAEAPPEATAHLTLLSDANMAASAAFGLAFALDEATVANYKSFGVPLTARHGSRYWLPIPAVYVVDRSGTITFAHADPDYRRRLPIDVLLAAVRAAGQATPDR